MATYNPGPDDALYFLNSSPDAGPDLFDAAEDPTGGKQNPNALPQFNHAAPKGGTLRVRRTMTTLTHGTVSHARQL